MIIYKNGPLTFILLEMFKLDYVYYNISSSYIFIVLNSINYLFKLKMTFILVIKKKYLK